MKTRKSNASTDNSRSSSFGSTNRDPDLVLNRAGVCIAGVSGQNNCVSETLGSVGDLDGQVTINFRGLSVNEDMNVVIRVPIRAAFLADDPLEVCLVGSIDCAGGDAKGHTSALAAGDGHGLTFSNGPGVELGFLR
ncbi:Uncharacterized protein HZ326_30599 [Fusarium oxysporum f. sp. albedinis]|nr:Uncharacterized protein HZ326_30599 [Fusarium oxysporum f. sp. albedinis]